MGETELVTYIHLRTQQGFVSQIVSIADYHSPTRQTPLKGRPRSFSILRDVSLTTFSKTQDSDTCSFLHPSRQDSVSIQRPVSFQSQEKTKGSLQQLVFSSRKLSAFSSTVAVWTPRQNLLFLSFQITAFMCSDPLGVQILVRSLTLKQKTYDRPPCQKDNTVRRNHIGWVWHLTPVISVFRKLTQK